jgi:hypothetical protein
MSRPGGSRPGGWTGERAARFGYLLGRGFTVEAIVAGAMLDAVSEHTLHAAVRRWGLPCNGSGPFVVPLSHNNRKALTAAARERNMTAEKLAGEALKDLVDQLSSPSEPSGEPPMEPPVDPPKSTNGAFAVPLAGDDHEALAAAAQVRGTTPAELALTILQIVVRDELFDAVIDNGD